MADFNTKIVEILRETLAKNSTDFDGKTDMDLLKYFLERSHHPKLLVNNIEEAVALVLQFSDEALSIVINLPSKDRNELLAMLEQTPLSDELLAQCIEKASVEKGCVFPPQEEQKLRAIFLKHLAPGRPLSRIKMGEDINKFLSDLEEIEKELYDNNEYLYQDDIVRFGSLLNNEMTLHPSFIARRILRAVLDPDFREVPVRSDMIIKNPASQGLLVAHVLHQYLRDPSEFKNSSQRKKWLLENISDILLATESPIQQLRGSVLSKSMLDNLLNGNQSAKAPLLNLYCLDDLGYANTARVKNPIFLSHINHDRALEIIDQYDDFNDSYIFLYIIRHNFQKILADEQLSKKVRTYLENYTKHASTAKEKEVGGIFFGSPFIYSRTTISKNGQRSI